MGYKYKAFISYRHKPLDMKVATRLHRAIERYKIPKDLRKDDVSKIGIVFRDQDELPISGSLSNNITEALDQSEFLIVICSPDTPQSEWVKREITYFTQTHDHDHVLSVLIDGEPEESFPEVLTRYYDSEKEQEIDVEPLAANIVADTDAKRWKLFAKEKLRIFASLLGCTFDELYKREQRYKRRRNLIIASAAAVIALTFIGVLLNRNAQIKKNYEESLRNQSIYLASESEKMIEEGDRLSAIALAIEALPSKEKDRPLVSKAQLALAKGVNAYAIDWNIRWADYYIADGALEHTEAIKDFKLNGSRDVLVSLTKKGEITGWDAVSFTKLWSMELETGEFERCGIAGMPDDDTVIVYSAYDVLFIDIRSGSIVFEQPVTQGEYTGINEAVLSADKTTLAVRELSTVYVLDTQSKNIDSTLRLGEAESFVILAISPDGSKIAVKYKDIYGLLWKGIRIIDIESGTVLNELSSFAVDELDSLNALFLSEDRLVLTYSDYVHSYTGVSEGMKVINFGQNTHYLDIIDLSSGRTVYEISNEYNSMSFNIGLECVEMPDGKKLIVDTYSDFLDLVDPESGRLLSHTEYPSAVVGIDVTKESDMVYSVHRDGAIGNVRAEDSDWVVFYPFVDEIQMVDFTMGDYWIVQHEGSSIIHYGFAKSDPTWSDISIYWPDDEKKALFSSKDRTFSEDSFALGNYDWDQFIYYDPQSETMEYRALPLKNDSGEYVSYYPISFDSKSMRLLMVSNGYYELMNVDLKTEEKSVYVFENDEMEICEVAGDSNSSTWDAIVRVIGESWDFEYYLVSFDNEFNIKKQVLIANTEEYEYESCWEDKDRMYMFFPGTGEMFTVNTKKYSLEKFPASCECIFGENVISAHFTDDGKYILILKSDHNLRRYDRKTGDVLSKTEINLDDLNLMYADDIRWTETDNDFIAMQIGNYCFMLSTKDWDVFTYIHDCIGYIPSKDFFVLDPGSYGYYQLGGFKRHTTESLIDYGKEILNGWELSETQKLRYGIE